MGIRSHQGTLGSQDVLTLAPLWDTDSTHCPVAQNKAGAGPEGLMDGQHSAPTNHDTATCDTG